MVAKSVQNLYRLLLLLIVLSCSSCSYLQHFHQQVELTRIQENISISKLDKVNEYTSRTPFHKTYEFEFNHSQPNAYALIFYMSESSFAKSIIKHRYREELHRDAIRIDESKSILTTLNKNLPKANGIAWEQVAQHISENDARDGYHILQEYIRLKIRNL